MNKFNGIQIFSATMVAQRQVLGETVTQWLTEARRRPGFEVVDIMIRQSSDSAYHCISILVFFNESQKKRAAP
jgi:hypothetical protein